MKRSVKLLSAVIVLSLLISLAPIPVSAYGAEDGKLVITHINDFGKEGSGVIFTPTHGDTVLGKLTYWVVVTFDWDENDNCFKVTKVQGETGDKDQTEIPKTGFVYGVNVGNNYPDLYAKTGNPAYAGKPNYVNDRTSKSYQFAKSLTVGTKASLYNVNIKSDVIDVSGSVWYSDSFITNSYIKIGTPDPTGTPYDPNNAEEILVQQTLGLTHINTATYTPGMSKIFTRSFGSNIVKSTGEYQWWRVAIFDWDDQDGCYKVIGVDTLVGNNYSKYAMIPENGFVVAAITGNSVSEGAYNAIANVKVGNKAYLYGVDVAAGTMSEGAKVTINLPDESLTPYTPTITNRLVPPVLTNMTGRTVTTKDGFTVEWSAVDGATGYVVNINKSTLSQNGPFIVENETVTGTSYTIGEGVLEVANNYTVSVYAVGTDRSASMVARAKLYVVSDEAASSSLSTKRIVAYGDSLTARNTWVNILAGRFGAELINAGVGGDTSTQGRARIKRDVLDYNPDIVLINFGMNDQAVVNGEPLTSIEKYTENLEYFAQTLIGAGADVIFVTPNKVCTAQGYHNPGPGKLNYGTDSMLAFCEAMRKVAMKYGCGLVDINQECSYEDLTKFCASGDGVHQSEYGHQKYAEYIGNYLAAVYDNKNLTSVEVKFEDAAGNSLAEPVTMQGAVGARVLIPGLEIDGYLLVSSPVDYQFADTPGSVTLTYAPIGIELKESSAFVIEDNNLYINVELLTVEGLLSQVKTSGVACTLSSGSYVGTGSKLQLKSGSEVLSELTVILLGDVDGDGEISSFDYLKVKRYILGNDTLEGVYLSAANTDQDDVIDSVDYLNIKRHIVGSKPLF